MGVAVFRKPSGTARTQLGGVIRFVASTAVNSTKAELAGNIRFSTDSSAEIGQAKEPIIIGGSVRFSAICQGRIPSAVVDSAIRFRAGMSIGSQAFTVGGDIRYKIGMNATAWAGLSIYGRVRFACLTWINSGRKIDVAGKISFQATVAMSPCFEMEINSSIRLKPSVSTVKTLGAVASGQVRFGAVTAITCGYDSAGEDAMCLLPFSQLNRWC